MSIKYSRTGGWKPPRDRELIEIDDDGNFKMWRSVGWVTQPPTPVGRFAGCLDAKSNKKLRAQSEVVAGAGNLQITPKPDSPVETIKVGAAEARLGTNDNLQGEWKGLVEHLRTLLGELTDSPEAAIELQVDKLGRVARLSRIGEGTLKVDLSGMEVRAVLWEAYLKKGDWRAPAGHSGDMANLDTRQGWTLDLPFDHGFDVTEGREVVAYVTFKAYDGTQAVPVSLQSPRKTAVE